MACIDSESYLYKGPAADRHMEDKVFVHSNGSVIVFEREGCTLSFRGLGSEQGHCFAQAHVVEFGGIALGGHRKAVARADNDTRLNEKIRSQQVIGSVIEGERNAERP